jgi:branched-chain amino acid transport system permease protein
VADLVQDLVSGSSLGAQYALLALGLAMVFSVMHLVNFAHGELITLPGYSMLGLYSLGAPWIVMAIGAIVTGVAAALAMERTAFRPVRNAPPTTMLLTSFGLAIIIQALLASLVSARPQAVAQPDWLGERITVLGVSIQWQQLGTIVVTAIALTGLVIFLRRSMTGIAMRAAATDFDATRLMGVNANRVISVAFAISGFLAGLAAVAYLARVGTVNPHMGLTPVLFAFVASVIGGIGSLKGAAVGGFVLGFVEVALRNWLPEDMIGFTPAFLFLAVAILLVVRPRGLFGTDEAVRV